MGAGAAPTKSLVGAKEIGYAENAEGWENPYVTDGLIAMWDGEWNAGPFLHESNPTIWKDISGNGYDLDEFDGVSFHDTSVTITKYAKSQKSLASFVTLEVVMSNIPGGYPTLFQCGGDTSYRNPYRVIFYKRKLGWPSVITGNGAINCSNYTTIPTHYTLISSPRKSYLNGIAINDGSTSEYYTGESFTSIGSPSHPATNLKIFRMALYSKALSETEVLHNYAVDKERFGL
jgi:hypothetical protein